MKPHTDVMIIGGIAYLWCARCQQWRLPVHRHRYGRRR